MNSKTDGRRTDAEKRFRRVLASVCAAALIAAAVWPVSLQAADGKTTATSENSQASALLAADRKIRITSKNNQVPTFQAGQKQKWTMEVHNNTTETLSGAVLSPDLGEDNDAWPFKTEYQHYSQELDDIAPGTSQEVTFEFTQREDVPTTRYTLQFGIFIEDEAVASQRFYVNTTAKTEDPADDGGKGSQSSDMNQADPYMGNSGTDTGDYMDSLSADAGGYSNEGVSYGGSDGITSVPRVIVTGFSTNPEEVHAGSNFILTIHLKNTSKKSRVSNMLFELNAPSEGTDEQTMSPAFLPASGSNAIYLDGIAASGTADISIELNAKSDLLQKPYSIDLSMKYEDAQGGQIDAASSISIPVKQDARFEFSDFEISPESIEVGDEANVMCSLYNLGRVKLYNVKAIFEGACIEKEEVFLGNIDSGATASIDAMLEGKTPTEGPAAVKMTLSYEDESGNVSTAERELQLEVTEEMDESLIASDIEMEEDSGFPIFPVIVIAVLIVVAAAAVLIIKKKKKKQMQNEEEGLLDELDRPSEDEQR